MFKCTNCSWQGESAKDNTFCPVCGDWVKAIESPKKEVEGDLNKDGKFDKKDLTIASKTLAKGKTRKRKTKKK